MLAAGRTGSRNEMKFVMVNNSGTLWLQTSAGINSFDSKTATAVPPSTAPPRKLLSHVLPLFGIVFAL
jgi:hypothetical protein